MKLILNKKFKIFCFIAITFFSCNPEEEVPSYIYIEEITLNTDISEEGSSSSKISDAWVFIDENLIGAFELPVYIPVLETGSHDIKIRPGIKNNGISSDRKQYPFYSDYDIELNLQPFKVDSVKPSVNYINGLNFWTEDLESIGIAFTHSSNSDTLMKITNVAENVFEGDGSAVVYLDEVRQYFLAFTNQNFEFPAGRPVYLELDYNSNNSFSLGMYSRVSGEVFKNTLIILKPTINDLNERYWNKAYIELTSLTSSGTADEHELFIEILRDSDEPLPSVFFDNIKIVY